MLHAVHRMDWFPLTARSSCPNRTIANAPGLVTIAAALAVWTVGARAAAQVPGGTIANVDFNIDCPALDRETVSLLEARGRAQLALEPVSGARIEIACDDSRAAVRRRDKAGAVRERTVTLSGDRASDVDALLDALQVVAFPPIASSRASAAGQTTVPSAASALSASGASGASAERVSSSDAPDALPPAAAPPAPPAPDAIPPRTGAGSLGRLALVAGVDGEMWQGGAGSAWGGYVGARWAFARAWAVRLTLGPAWGVSSVASLSAWRLRAVATVEAAPYEHLLLDAGLAGRILWVDQGSSEQVGSTAGPLVSARFVGRVGPAEVAAGPELEALVRSVSVEVDGTTRFEMPSVIVGATLEMTSP